MNAKTIIAIVIVTGMVCFGTVSALVLKRITPQTNISEVVNSTIYAKNADGTVNKIEDVTRTTTEDPSYLNQQIQDLQQNIIDLQAQKAMLDNAK